MSKQLQKINDQNLEKSSIDYRGKVERLKKYLIGAQMNFLKAGKELFEIKEGKFIDFDGKKIRGLYKLEDSSFEWSWKNFCNRPDLPFITSSSNPDSRVSLADRVIRVYHLFKKKYSFEDEYLGQIGYTKLYQLAPTLSSEKISKEDVVQWLLKAETLTVSDLISEIQTRDKTLTEILDCTHPADQLEEVKYFRCKLCKQNFTAKPKPTDETDKKAKKLAMRIKIDELLGFFLYQTGLKDFGESRTWARRWAYQLIKKYDLQASKDCIEWMIGQDFWKDKLAKLSTVYYQMPNFKKKLED